MYLEKARGPGPRLRSLRLELRQGKQSSPKKRVGGAARRKEENQQCVVAEVILS